MKASALRQTSNWTKHIDRVIQLLKWPAAWAAACAAPLLAWSAGKLAMRILFNPLPLLPFVAGIVLFVLLWRRLLGKSRVGRLLITVEHESTHALFALLTGHRLVGFKASMGHGGEVRFAGHGNWLITAAPYFFPTAALLLFLIAYLLPFPGLPWQRFLLGVALGYHIVSTFRETHGDQSDLRVLGRAFCWFFLPAANLVVIGLLISFAHQGTAGIQEWISDIMEPIRLAGEWWRAFTSAFTTQEESTVRLPES